MPYRSKEDHIEYNNNYRERNRLSIRDKDTLARRKLKRMVLEAYGESCANCGFDDYRALHIDHIDNNGAEERISLGGRNYSGWIFYRHLVNSGFQPG